MLHEDLNRVLDKPYVQIGDVSGMEDNQCAKIYWDNFTARNKSIIVDLMYGQLKSTVRCLTCSNITTAFDPFVQLQLPLEPLDQASEQYGSQLTIDDCLDYFSSEETLTGDDRWFCPTCREHREITKKLQIYTTPKILCFQLKRFT